MKPMDSSRLYKAAVVAAIALTAIVSAHVQAQQNVLIDRTGMSAYTFAKDSPSTSACYGECAAAWPPVEAWSMPAGSDLRGGARRDGVEQVASQGKPSYLFEGDRKPGGIIEDNAEQVRYVVYPSAKTSGTAVAPRATSAGHGY